MQEPKQKSQKEEISLKDLLLTLKDWWAYLLSKWLILGIAGLAGAGLGLAYAYSKKPVYKGELTFILEESKGGGAMSAYAGIASQFGIDLGGSSSGVGVFSGDNILAFLKSRLMVEKTLLSPVKTDKGQISLADFYIDVNNYRKGWKKNPRLNAVSFPVNPDRSKFSLLQDSILFTIYEAIVKNDLLVSKPDKKMSFISVTCSSTSEVFAKEFVETLVTEATDFYVATKTKRSKANVDVLQAKADSLEHLLNRKTYSAAASQDINLNPVRNVASVGTEVALRDKAMLQVVYGEVVKNLEISKLSMAQETPLIQLIDRPILPLKAKSFGKLKGIVFGGILGVVMLSVILLVRRILREIMA